MGSRRAWVLGALGLVVACRPKHEAGSAPVIQDAAATIAPPAASPWAGDTLALTQGAGGTFGDVHPIRWAVGDPKRRWAITCEQRIDTRRGGVTGHVRVDGLLEDGGKPAEYFILGGGLGRPIDAVVATSRTGDHVVVEMDGAIALVDVAAKLARRLPGARPLAVFSGDGKRLVYLADSQIVRRDLATGAETRRPLPAGRPEVVDLDTRGRWLVIAMARPGGRGTTYLDAWWPAPPRCELGRGHIGYELREPAEKVWVDLDRGDVRDDQTIVRIAGDHVLAQPSLEALTLDGKPFGPRHCKALRANAVHEAPFAVVVACRAERDSVVVVGPHPASFGAHLLSIDAIAQLAPMLHEDEDCPEGDAQCVNVITGEHRPIDFVWLAMGVHGDEAWYESTRTHLLVGAPDHGPLHWRRQTPGDR